MAHAGVIPRRPEVTGAGSWWQGSVCLSVPVDGQLNKRGRDANVIEWPSSGGVFHFLMPPFFSNYPLSLNRSIKEPTKWCIWQTGSGSICHLVTISRFGFAWSPRGGLTREITSLARMNQPIAPWILMHFRGPNQMVDWKCFPFCPHAKLDSVLIVSEKR